MRNNYRKIVTIVSGVQIMLLCCYILYLYSRIKYSPSTQLELNQKIFNIFPPRTQSSEIKKTINLTNISKTKELKKEMHVTYGDCLGIRYPAALLTKESWSEIDEEKNSFVFSAYRIDQSGTIKVVGASIIGNTREIFCQYWRVIQANGTVIMHEKPANMHILPEGHRSKYSEAIFTCKAISTSHPYISLVSSHCRVPLHLLHVKNGIAPENYQRQYTVCLRPLHFWYGRAYELVEWIEFNRILGAEKFVVYNYSIALNTHQVLNHYVEKGIVEVVQWNLPINSYIYPRTPDPVDIHSMGTLPMLQDCLFRNRAYSKFLVNADVDEFMIPHSDNSSTWSDLFRILPSGYDTYIFLNTFFRKEWNNETIQFQNKTFAQKLNITSLQKFEREDKIYPARFRSKYFTRTIKIDKSLLMHEVSGSRSYKVPVDKGLLHHYRYWHNHSTSSRRIIDKTVLYKYEGKLIQNIQNTWKKLGNVQRDIPI